MAGPDWMQKCRTQIGEGCVSLGPASLTSDNQVSSEAVDTMDLMAINTRWNR